MKDEKIIAMVDRCEQILQQVEAHASSIEKMHDHMKNMIEHNKKLQHEMQMHQQENMRQQVTKLASKAARKAVKKSIAKAKIRESLIDQDLKLD